MRRALLDVPPVHFWGHSIDGLDWGNGRIANRHQQMFWERDCFRVPERVVTFEHVWYRDYAQGEDLGFEGLGFEGLEGLGSGGIRV